MAQPFVGEIRLFAGGWLPYGWLACDGARVDMNEYWKLFRMIGGLYGPYTKDSFQLPDLDGRAVLGYTPRSPYEIGQWSGQPAVYLKPEHIPAHTHPMSRKSPVSPSSKGNIPSRSSDIGVLAEASNNKPYTMMANGPAVSELHWQTIGPAWNGGDLLEHENRQPFLSVLFGIAFEGLLPEFD